MAKQEKAKETVSEGITSDERVNENVAPSADAAPAVAEKATPNYTVKGGIDMVKVDSPSGSPSGNAGFRSVGGGARNPSSDYSRVPGDRNVRSAGSDALNKLDIRRESDWNEIGAQQLETQVQAQPAGFEAGTIKGNYLVQSNPVFQIDNTRNGAGKLNKPGRVRTATMGRDFLLYARGQNDGLQSGVVSYPTLTTGNDGTETVISIGRGDYLLRGMTVNFDNGAISGVTFDVSDITSTSEEREELDSRVDHAKLCYDIASKKTTQDLFNLINDPSNLQQNKYSPIADGYNQALEHMLLANDIFATDGVIAMAAMRGYGEAYGLHRYLRSQYGSGHGSCAQAKRAFIGMTGHTTDAEDDVWAITPTTHASPLGATKTATAYILDFVDSPTKYRDTFGVWMTQARGVLFPFQNATDKFDADGFYADKDAVKTLQTLFKWQQDTSALVGHSGVGIVIPYNPNDIFEYSTVSRRLISRVNIVDYVMNGNLRQGTNLCSPLFQGIIQAINEIAVPKGMGTGSFYIPFEFSTDKFTYSDMWIAEGIARAYQFNLKSRGVFDRFKAQYGTDPILDDITVSLSLADVFGEASFRGLGADASFGPLNEASKLILETPETIDVSAGTKDEGVTDRMVGEAIIAFDQMGQRGKQLYQFGFPILNNGARLEAYDDLIRIGSYKFFRTRDQAMRRPLPTSTIGVFSTYDEVSGEYDPTCPFFSGNVEGGMAGNAIKISGNCAGATAGNHGTFAISVRGIIELPRINGRIAPAPRNILKYVMTDGKTGGWAGKLDDSVLSITASSDAAYANAKVNVVLNPVESYDISFPTDEIYQADSVGQMLARFCVYAQSGGWSAGASDVLATTWGIYVDPSAASEGYKYPLVKSDNNAGIFYSAGVIIATWCNNNLFSFVRNPFNSVYGSAAKNESLDDTRIDLSLAAAFNLVGYQQLSWREEALRVQNVKLEAKGWMTDNALERADNLTLN